MHAFNTQAEKSASLLKEAQEIDLLSLLKTLLQRKWWIASTMLICFLIGLIVVENEPVVYQSKALIQVTEQSTRTSIASLGTFGTLLTPRLGGVSESNIEMTLMHSDYILKPTIQKFGLDIQITPLHAPFFGYFFAPKNETITLSAFNPPLNQYLKRYSLVVDEKNTYQLFDPDGKLILKGVVGTLAHSADGETNILVSQINAQPHAHFKILHLDPIRVAEDLSHSLKLTELSSDGSTGAGAGIIQISLNSEHPKQSAAILNNIIQLITQDSEDQKKSESDKTSQLIQVQLVLAEKNLTQAQKKLNSHKAKVGTIGLSAQSKLLLAEISSLDAKFFSNQIEKEQLLQNNTVKSPLVQNINIELQSLQHQRAKLQNQLARLPSQEQDSINLMRDVQVQSKIYLALQNSLQQALLMKASSANTIRVLEYAEPPIQPLPSKSPLILIFSLLCGFFVASFGVLVFTQLAGRITDPYWTQKRFTLPTLGIVPFSSKHGQNLDASTEALRTFRTTLFSVLKAQKSNVFSIGSVMPKAGKSFISTHLAIILARSHKRILLIDADVERGHIAQHLDLPSTPGFSELLSETAPLEQVLHHTTIKGLDVISAGSTPPHISELFLHDHFQKTLQHFSSQYDIVLINTPPILLASDASLIAQSCGLNFLVIASGQLKPQEIEAAMRRFHHDGITITGTIFNSTKKGV